MWLINKLWEWVGDVALFQAHRWQKQFEAALHRPQEVQRQLLERIITTHKGTQFGRDYRFGDIKTVADFRKQIPVLKYEDHEPYIAQVRQGKLDALVNAKTVHMFAMTSGTTATRKYIPVTPQYLEDYRRGWTLWGVRVYDQHVEARLKSILQLNSDCDEFRTEAGIPCGSVSGLTAQMQKRVVRRLYLVPAIACKIKDSVAKMYLALRLALTKKMLGMAISANPSTFIKFAQLGDEAKEDLIRDLYDGTLSSRYTIAPEIRDALGKKIRKRHIERAKELEDVVKRTGHLYPKDAWPEFVQIGNWMGGSVGLYLRQYPRYYDTTKTFIRDLGLIASEGRFTISLEDGTPGGVLDVQSHFFEFIPEAEIDSPQPTVLLAHELEVGKNYYILPTTAYGLYRYNIYDVVRCTGYYHKTPMVEFLNKGANFANLTGEKLSEYHVVAAVRQALVEMDHMVSAYTVAPCWDDETPYYGLFVEGVDFRDEVQAQSLADAVDRQLRRINMEYDTKRESQRLAPLQAQLLPSGTWTKWDRDRLAKCGGTPEQYKRPALISDPKFRETMPVVKGKEVVTVG
jgi:hypothetical protein